jgi:hypothetical protein
VGPAGGNGKLTDCNIPPHFFEVAKLQGLGPVADFQNAVMINEL